MNSDDLLEKMKLFWIQQLEEAKPARIKFIKKS
jgi:hypothetical protein